MGDFIGSIWFFVLLGIILLALIGLFIYLRKKEED
jgi:LPXTG-motif cell wall-anchored protein